MKRDPVAVAKLRDPDEPVVLEVMAPNEHDDYRVTEHTLHTLAENFKKLWSYGLRPPLRIGHKEPGTGMERPSVGTIVAVAVRPDAEGRPKLMAEVTGVPAVVKAACASRLYARASSEITKRWELTDDERQNMHSGVTGEVLTGVSLCGEHLPRVKSLADLVPLVDDAESADASGCAVTFSESWDERLDRIEAGIAMLSRTGAAARARLHRLQARHAEQTRTEGTRTTMATVINGNATPTKSLFRAAVDEEVKKNGGDVNDPAARLTAARTVLRDLATAQEITVDTETYLYGLATQLQLATPGWGPSNLAVTTKVGGLGGLQPRQEMTPPSLYGMAPFREANAMTFDERPTVTPRTSAECHRAADALANEHPDLVRQYTGRPRTEPLPGVLAERLHHHLAKLPVTEPNRVGAAMRAVAAELPSAAPRYGWSAR